MCSLYLFRITEQYFTIFWHLEREGQNIVLSVKAGWNWLLWSFPQTKEGSGVPMILSIVVVSHLVMVTTWLNAVQNCSVLMPTQPTGSNPRRKHEVITFCVKEMNPCRCFCNIRSFCSTLSISCEGKFWLSWSYMVRNNCACHILSSEASYVL
jgi:hypothetical protein